jgi:hypothetical protein
MLRPGQIDALVKMAPATVLRHDAGDAVPNRMKLSVASETNHKVRLVGASLQIDVCTQGLDTDAKATNAAGIDFASAMSMMTLCRAGTPFSLPRLSSRPSAAAQPDNRTSMATIRLSLSNSLRASRAP